MIRQIYRRIEGATNAISKRLSRRGLSEFIRRELDGLTAGCAVMSVGSGGETGLLVKAICEARGIELVEVDIDPARRPDVVADLCDLPFGAGSFDGVLVLEVMEHVARPDEAVRQVQRVLRPGGKLVWSTPFLFPIHDEPHDFFRYTKYGLARMLDRFETVVIVDKMGPHMTVLALRCRLAREMRRGWAPVGLLQACWLWLQTPLARAMDRWKPSPVAPLGYFVTAVRGEAAW